MDSIVFLAKVFVGGDSAQILSISGANIDTSLIKRLSKTNMYLSDDDIYECGIDGLDDGFYK